MRGPVLIHWEENILIIFVCVCVWFELIRSFNSPQVFIFIFRKTNKKKKQLFYILFGRGSLSHFNSM